MKYGVIAILSVVSLLSMPVQSVAHHSFAGQFDPSTSIELEGELVRVRWINPHAYLTVETGDGVQWELETAGAIQLARSGVEREFFQIGDRVRAAGWPPVTEAREMHATNMLLPDGRELVLARNAAARFADRTENDYAYAGQREGDASRPDLGVFRVWSFTSASPFLFPEDVNPGFDLDRYPMTQEARAMVAAFDRAADNPTRNCTPKGMPTIMEQPYRMELIDDGGDIRIRIEEYDLVRVVDMDRVASDSGETTPLGFSVGRWEGETLVVTTTRINWPWFDQVGVPQSSESTLVERFTPSLDGSRLDYTLTVTDPVNFTRPVSLERFWLDLGGTLVPYECTDRNE